jgi:hypothetical protein
MTELKNSDRTLGSAGLETLVDEIRLYLEAVELFRREGREPRWLSERSEKEALP